MVDKHVRSIIDWKAQSGRTTFFSVKPESQLSFQEEIKQDPKKEVALRRLYNAYTNENFFTKGRQLKELLDPEVPMQRTLSDLKFKPLMTDNWDSPFKSQP